jgi:hypothetical protein
MPVAVHPRPRKHISDRLPFSNRGVVVARRVRQLRQRVRSIRQVTTCA